MLLDAQTQRLIDRLLEDGLSDYSAFAIGTSLGENLEPGQFSATGGFNLAQLEQAYLAGKVAAVVGVDNARRMTPTQLISVAQSRDIELTESDRITMSSIGNDTQRWLQGRTEVVKQRFGERLQSLDQTYRGELANAGTAETFGSVRAALIADLVDEMGELEQQTLTDIDRINQTQMASYFQAAYVAGAAVATEVWKLPRTSAEKHCMRLHLNPDGSPRVFVLGDVRGNSNIGRPPSAWQFVIGPVHPHCYCILYTSDDKGPLGKSKSRSRARSSAVTPSEAGVGRLQKATENQDLEWECCPPGEEPEHMTNTRAAVAAEYGEDSPVR